MPNNQIEATCWKTIIEKVDLRNLIKEQHFADMEELFSQKKTEAKAKMEKAKPTKVNPLDPKRAYAVDISLGRLRHMSFDDIRYAILTLDENRLNDEMTTQLIKIVPTPEELELIGAEINGGTKLSMLDGSAEFFYALKDVRGCPDMQTRLELFHFKLNWNHTIHVIEEQLSTVAQQAKQLKHSKALREIFRVLLELGNFMNSGNAQKAEKFGFKLQSLNQIKGTKSNDNQVSLLQYALQIMPSESEEAMQKDFSLIAAVAKTEQATVEGEVNKIKGNLDKLANAIKVYESASDPEDRFAEKMSSFLAEATKRAAGLQKTFTETKKRTDELCEYFGERPMNWEDLFNKFDEFYKAYVEALRMVARQKGADDKKKSKEKEKKEKDKDVEGKPDKRERRQSSGSMEKKKKKDKLHSQWVKHAVAALRNAKTEGNGSLQDLALNDRSVSMQDAASVLMSTLKRKPQAPERQLGDKTLSKWTDGS